MEHDTHIQLSKRAVEALANIPPAPSYLFDAVMRQIDRKKILMRALFSVAATVIIAVTAFSVTAYRMTTQRASYSPEVAADLQRASNYYNNDVCKENANSYEYYQEVLYQE